MTSHWKDIDLRLVTDKDPGRAERRLILGSQKLLSKAHFWLPKGV